MRIPNLVFHQPLEEELKEELDRQRRPLLRFSTAGSVDDGKSTLIGRLLHDSKSLYDDHVDAIKLASAKEGKDGLLSFALLTDGLRAEREQGITIDVAYRYFSTGRRNFIMADAPGHEQYTRNMATGASNAEVTVILVDARKGLLTQTRRHAFVAALMGVHSFIVAINKMDLVSYSREVFEQIRHDFAEFGARLEIPQIQYIPMSALKGENIVHHANSMPWYDGPTLLECLDTIPLHEQDRDAPLRFSVQYVLKDRDYRGYAGRIASGVVSVDDDVLLLPSGRRTRIRGIELPATVPGTSMSETAAAPQSIVITLDDQVDLGRGAMIVSPESAPALRESFESMLVWMSDSVLDLNKPYLLRQGTDEARVFVDAVQYRVNMQLLSREPIQTLALNDIGRVEIISSKPLALESYRRNRATGNFILIDPETLSTVAAGMVVDRFDHGILSRLSDAQIVMQPKAANIHLEEGSIRRSDREALSGFPAMTMWFTGLSGSGKSSLAKRLEQLLIEDGRPCYRLDGDNLRFGLNRDLGFSEEDRQENIRRSAEAARLMNEAGVTTLCSFISPYERDRESARRIIGNEFFLEIFVNTPLEVCESRDPHGLYRRARRGEIAEFTGISSPYEAPRSFDLMIDTSTTVLESCAQMLFDLIQKRAPRRKQVRHN